MNSVRVKNVIIIVLITVIAAAIIGGSVYVAVTENRSKENREYFFDVAPINYSSSENFAYAKQFREAVGHYFESLIPASDISVFADKMLEAMSVSGISADKVGKMASAIKKYNLKELLHVTDLEKVETEDIKKLLDINALDTLNDFLNGFFEESGLTGEEAGTILYNYLDKNSSSEYKKSLHAMGMSRFVRFISMTIYAFTSVSDLNTAGETIASSALKAGLYELGGAMLDVTSQGTDVFEKVFGLVWEFDKSVENSAEINGYTIGITGKIGYVLPLAGYILKEIKTYDIEALRGYAESGDKTELVLSHQSLAFAIRRGTDRFLTEYSALGKDREELKSQLKLLFRNLFAARLTTSGISSEIFDDPDFDLFDVSDGEFDEFFDGVEKLTERLYNAEEVNGSEDREALIAAAESLSIAEKKGSEFISAIAYMWLSRILKDAQKEM